MTKTTVKAHPRKGTRGVKMHSRNISSSNKYVPHNTKERMTLNQLVKDLGLELRHLYYSDTQKDEYKELEDFNAIPEELRNKKWNFDVEIDRIPVEKSTEFGYIEMKGYRKTGTKKVTVQTGVDILRGRIIPIKYDKTATYQEISFDSQLINPVEEWDKVARRKITKNIKKVIKTNYPNPNNKIKFHWEKRK
jgi:hypothetical protein